MRVDLARGCRMFASAAVGASVLVGQLFVPGVAQALPKAVPPVLTRTSKVVTADALPTVQIDGVVWKQAMIGNTVYAGGEFTTARPAGAAPGESTTPRSNLLAYSIVSGKLNTTFKPAALNGQVKAVAVSTDHTTIFIGGDFTTVGTAARNHFAALDARTGALLKANPSFNSTVKALIVVGTTVYAGGTFTSVGGKNRSRLAAVSGSTGHLTTWAPAASARVEALVATPDHRMIIAGGAFTTLNGKAAYGMGAIGLKTGLPHPWKVNSVVRNAGTSAAILSLAADGDTIYGTGYTYGKGGNFEGTFAASPKDGTVKWLQDCHGDSYGVAPVGGTVYIVGHAHYCANIGGFSDTSPRTRWQRALAVTKVAKGTVAKNGQPSSTWQYGDFGGQPAPALYNWFPDIALGGYTKQYQGAWSIVGNATYVSAGGEFPSVNGTPQQGLVRFALATVAPRKQGPQLSDASTSPQPTAGTNGGVALSWTTNSDQDDRTLSYQVLRDDKIISPVVKKAATFWDRRTMTWTDPDVTEGLTYSYVIRATDSAGNSVDSPSASYTVPVTTSSSEGKESATPTPTPTPSAGG